MDYVGNEKYENTNTAGVIVDDVHHDCLQLAHIYLLTSSRDSLAHA
jgi:hypothetical protein